MATRKGDTPRHSGDEQLREHVVKLLDWEDAHVGFDSAVDGISAEHRGTAPAGLPYSPWQLVEHIRIAQEDILDFSRNASYQAMTWPDDYWPKDPAPPTAKAWDESLAAIRKDREALQQLAGDTSIDLFARIPHGDGQTYLRELLLIADHTAYHVGELILVRRLLGIWPSK